MTTLIIFPQRIPSHEIGLISPLFILISAPTKTIMERMDIKFPVKKKMKPGPGLDKEPMPKV
jgi:hypothetical protein